MNSWLYGETDRQAVCDLFKAHADDEIEVQHRYMDGEWCEFAFEGNSGIDFDDTYRYRLKPRKLAKYWKKLEGDGALPQNLVLIDERDPEDFWYTSSTGVDPESWREHGWTHWATRDAILYGVGDV